MMSMNKISFFLIFMIIFSLILTNYSHFNYKYPLHVDEWFHITIAKELSVGEELNWYTSKPLNLDLEKSWHLLLGTIQWTFNLDVTQWIFVPIILHALAILSVYYLISKFFNEKVALISALLVALIPSNVTIGGPALLVPVNLSLIFIPLALLFAFELVKIRKIYNYAILFAITTFMLYAHPPSAIILLIILITYSTLKLLSRNKDDINKSKILFLVIAVSILASVPNFIQVIQEKGVESIQFDFWVQLREIPIAYGIIPTVFFIVGFYFLSKSKNKEVWSILLSTLILILIIVFSSRFDINWLIPYQRVYIPLFLLMSMVASFGFYKLTEIKKYYKNLGVILLIAILAVTTYFAVERTINTPYYHLIDDTDYQNFLWIKENTPKDAIIILDPLKARALPAVAERRVYSVLPFGPNEEQMAKVDETNQFFEGSCANTIFLRQNEITVVYSREGCMNPGLEEVKESIYVRKN